MATTVVKVRRGEPKGPRYDVYIGRRSRWGNPYTLPRNATPEQRAEAIAEYRAYILGRPDLLAHLGMLRGLRLGCWCAPLPCHGDVLAELADAEVTL